MHVPSIGGGILVADDTIDSLRLLTSVLAQQGYEVRPVTSGRQALQAAVHMPPELVLLDVGMPELDGYEVCLQLKANSVLANIPVIFLTAHNDTASKVKAFGVGGADYITKPFQISEVIARVKAHLGLRRAQLELRQQYDRLRTLERLRDDLVHMVVHDMRSPITTLFCNLEVLLGRLAATPNTQEALAEVRGAREATAALSRMTNDLLDVSRLEEEKLPLALGATDLVELAHRVRAALANLDRERTIEVNAAGPVAVRCDQSIVRRILENLVGNAIKHTPSGGRIQISLAELTQRVRVSVQDEGPGVPLAARTKIFEKFGTVSARESEKFHSSGLGLAFCKLAVEAHGGCIGIDPVQPTGSSFLVRAACVTSNLRAGLRSLWEYLSHQPPRTLRADLASRLRSGSETLEPMPARAVVASRHSIMQQERLLADAVEIAAALATKLLCMRRRG